MSKSKGRIKRRIVRREKSKEEEKEQEDEEYFVVKVKCVLKTKDGVTKIYYTYQFFWKREELAKATSEYDYSFFRIGYARTAEDIEMVKSWFKSVPTFRKLQHETRVGQWCGLDGELYDKPVKIEAMVYHTPAVISKTQKIRDRLASFKKQQRALATRDGFFTILHNNADGKRTFMTKVMSKQALETLKKSEKHSKSRVLWDYYEMAKNNPGREMVLTGSRIGPSADIHGGTQPEAFETVPHSDSLGCALNAFLNAWWCLPHSFDRAAHQARASKLVADLNSYLLRGCTSTLLMRLQVMGTIVNNWSGWPFMIINPFRKRRPTKRQKISHAASVATDEVTKADKLSSFLAKKAVFVLEYQQRGGGCMRHCVTWDRHNDRLLDPYRACVEDQPPRILTVSTLQAMLDALDTTLGNITWLYEIAPRC